MTVFRGQADFELVLIGQSCYIFAHENKHIEKGDFMRNFKSIAAGSAKVFIALLFISIFLLFGCASTSNIRMEKGLSLEVFEHLGSIDRQPATIGVLIPDELRNSVIERKVGETNYTLDLGNTLGAKVIQILSYQSFPIWPSAQQLDAAGGRFHVFPVAIQG